jgi:outer membrane protein assembly factor BamB
VSKFELSRRHLVAAAAAIGATAATHRISAQEATPEDAVHGGEEAGATPVALGPAVPPEYDTATNWPSENYDLKGTRNAQGSNISSETIGTLGDAWKFNVDISAAYGALVTPPSIVDGVVYQQDAMSNVYAIDLETGETIWTIEHNEAVPSGGPNGTAVAYGNVYYTLGGPGDVIAVDAATGEQIWSNNIQGPKNEGITISPLVYDNIVYVSTIPGTVDGFYDGGERGMIHAMDASTGEVIWYFDTTTDNLWGNAVVNSGGGLWHPPSVDEDGMIYGGIGNAGPYPGTEEYPNSTSRLGDNDYANAIVKIDPATGSLVWYLNVKPFDLFDLDNHLTPVLTTATIDGAERKVAITTGKHAWMVAVDQETGEELWRTGVGPHENDLLEEIPEGETVTVFPGTLGGVETPIAVANGKIFAPIFNMASVYSPSEMDFASFDIASATGMLVCLDVNTGEILWEVEMEKGTLGAATAVNDLVFTGALDGVVRAYNQETGEQVWSYQASAGLNAPFAISGDYLFIPAAGPLFPSSDTFADVPDAGPNLIALKLGGTVQEAGETASPAAEEATPEAGAAGSSDAIAVSAIDISFEQKELSIAADTDVTITVTNNGMLQHDLVIEGTDYATPILNGGDSAELVVNLPAGEYFYFCSVAGHREAGMQGTLTVA